jgi:N-acetylglucosamine-6-sulfatase
LFEQGRLPCPNSSKTNCGFSASACPTTGRKHAFDGVPAPHVPSWNRTASGGELPPAMQGLSLDEWDSWRQDIAYRNRSCALLDLDDLIGKVLDAVDAAGVKENTWVFFSSDNGYHLGEHELLFGSK